MKKPETWRLVAPRVINRAEPTTGDWRAYLAKHIVPEIHLEAHKFYGPQDPLELTHPGHDYISAGCRLRLGFYPRHQALFKAFDDLELTDGEINALCLWEGTKHAREFYEITKGRRIRDTTWDGVHPYDKPAPVGVATPLEEGNKIPVQDEVNTAAEEENRDPVEDETNGEGVRGGEAVVLEDLEEDGMEGVEDEFSEDESGDEIMQSFGARLHQQLVTATEARARGEQVSMGPEWEQWFKEAMERDGQSWDPSPQTTAEFIARTSAETQSALQNLIDSELPYPLATAHVAEAVTIPPLDPTPARDFQHLFTTQPQMASIDQQSS